jgi:hypothetical protein
MSLQLQIDKVKKQHPLWKSNSRIIGRAGWQGCNMHFTNIHFIKSAF